MKESLKSHGQKVHQYQQNEQSLLISNHWDWEKKPWNVGNPGSGLGEPQTYFDIGEIDDHPYLNFISITGCFALKPYSPSHFFSQWIKMK